MKKLTKSRIEWMIRTNQTYRLLKLLNSQVAELVDDKRKPKY